MLDFTGSWPRCHVSWWLLKRADQTRESCSSTSNCRPWPHQRLNRAGEEELKRTKLNLTDHPPLVTFLGTASETKWIYRDCLCNDCKSPVRFPSSPDSLSCQWSLTDSWRDAWGTPSVLIQSPCVWCLEKRYNTHIYKHIHIYIERRKDYLSLQWWCVCLL